MKNKHVSPKNLDLVKRLKFHEFKIYRHCIFWKYINFVETPHLPSDKINILGEKFISYSRQSLSTPQNSETLTLNLKVINEISKIHPIIVPFFNINIPMLEELNRVEFPLFILVKDYSFINIDEKDMGKFNLKRFTTPLKEIIEFLDQYQNLKFIIPDKTYVGRKPSCKSVRDLISYKNISPKLLNLKTKKESHLLNELRIPYTITEESLLTSL